MATDPLADLRADLAKPDPTPPPKTSDASPWRDPWAHVIQSVTPQLDKAGLLGSKEGMLRQAGGYLIPQNTAELALAGMMAFQPEAGLARLGVPLAEKLAASGPGAALARAGLRGLTTAGIAKATGQPALETGAYATGGSLVGEGLGKLGSMAAQRAASNLALGNVTKDLADRFQATIGQWLPKPKAGDAAYSPERIIRSVWSGEATAAVGQELNRIKAAHVHTPVSIIDLAPTMTEAGVVFEAPAAPSKLTPGRELATRRGLAPRGEMPLGEALDSIGKAREAWQTQTGPDKDIRLAQLKGIEDALTMRADPNYANVLKQWGRAKQLQDWLNVSAPSLFDGRTGRLSWEGYADLAQRLGKREPNAGRLASFTPGEVNQFGDALRLDLERGGMVWGEPGRWPIQSAGFGLTGRPHARLGIPQASWMPGWESEGGVMRRRLAPAAIRAITGLAGQAPLHLTPDRRDE